MVGSLGSLSLVLYGGLESETPVSPNAYTPLHMVVPSVQSPGVKILEMVLMRYYNRQISDHIH